MIIADTIKKVLEITPPGVIISVDDFDISQKYQPALVKALSRYVAKGVIQKVSKGRYYKPKNTVFGILKPSVMEVVKDCLESDSKLIGYITGPSAFAEMGLTTQISSSIMVGSNKYRRPRKRGEYSISFLLQPNVITEDNIQLLRILDALRLLRDIPASSPDDCVKGVCNIVKSLSENRRSELMSLAVSYTPYVRALLGAIIEYTGNNADSLRNSLKGITTYSLPVSDSILPTKTEWNIR